MLAEARAERRFLRARSVPGLLTRNCGLLRSVTAGEKRLVNAHGMGESAVRLLHRVPGTFPTLTTAHCCPSAARCRQRHRGTRPLGALAPGRVPGLGQRVSWAGGPR